MRWGLEAILMVPVWDWRTGRAMELMAERPKTVREPLNVEHAANAAMSDSDDAVTWFPHSSS